MSAPLTGFSNDRTDPSGKEMLIMVATTQEDAEHGSPADTKCRRRQAGKRHKGARPAESSSDGGGGWSGEEPAVHAGGDSCEGGPSQAEALAPDRVPAIGDRRSIAVIGARQLPAAPGFQPEMAFLEGNRHRPAGRRDRPTRSG